MAEEVDVDHNRHRSKSHSPTDAVEDADDPFKWHPPPPSRRSRLLRRRVVVCCGCCAALAALFAVLLLVLALTIYKVRDPEMTVNNIIISTAQPPSSSSSNVTSVVVDASMRNPNAVPYYFDESTTWFRYEDIEVGVARGPPGMAAAGRTYRVNVTVEVDGEGLAEALREVGREGEMAVDSVTEVRGHVRVLGIVRHQVDVTMNCTVTVVVGNWTVVDQSCAQEVYD